MSDLYINMPVGEHYGWGICGKNLVRELSKLRTVKYVGDWLRSTDTEYSNKQDGRNVVYPYQQ